MAKADPNLKQYCTDRQWEVMKAIASAGSMMGASRKLGIVKSGVSKARAAVLKKAAIYGYAPDYDLIHPVPDGFKLKGASTLYDAITGEAKMQWVKSEADKARQHEMFLEMIKGFTDDLPRVKPIPWDNHPLEFDLLSVYPVGDHHMGMLAWGMETGADYDMKIGEKMLDGAIQYLLKATPGSNHALIAFLGDFMHYDSFEAVTPQSRNQLDADSRFPKMVRKSINAMRNMIELALGKHAFVTVIVEIGNHDLSSSIFLMECLHNVYEDEPRVTIDTSPMHFHYFRFGKVLLGTHHGHGPKMDALPLIMASDRPDDWGATRYRHWLTGHIHTSKTLKTAVPAQDFVGCTVESFRILAPMDAWAHQKGYRSISDMKAIVYHKEFGEFARHTVNPEMLVSHDTKKEK